VLQVVVAQQEHLMDTQAEILIAKQDALQIMVLIVI
jgi:hypothetical protein